MRLNLKEHAPQARCHRCGSPELVSTCHHCGTYICEEHSPRVVNVSGRPVSREYDGMGLDGELSAAYHCTEHHHVVKSGLLPLILALAGLAVIVAGALAVIANLYAGLAVAAAGAVAAVWSYLVRRRRNAAARAFMPPLPVMPSLDSVAVGEQLQGRVTLGDDGTYDSTAQPVEGTVEVAMTLNKSDRDRLSAYRARYSLAEDDPVEFSAGMAVLEGEVGATFANGHEQAKWLLPDGRALAFRGEVSGHPLFSTGRGRSAGQWTARLPYRLQDELEPDRVPIWLVPSLVPGSDMRMLRVDLNWMALDEEQPERPRTHLKLTRFDVIELAVPTAWGNVETVSPSALVSNPETGFTRTIEWRLLSPAVKEDAESTTLTIRFQKPISQKDKLSGRLRATFKGTLSGITGVGMYWPTGASWLPQPKPSITMDAQVDFELSLNSVRYQAVRVVPDGEKDLDRPGVKDWPEVIPDHCTVAALTDELGNAGYYIKRVTENPPRGGGRANLVNRAWDIAGRRYDGVFPIDFHITITGEEEYQDGAFEPNAGRTRIGLTVRGAYVDPDMEQTVADAWDELHERVAANLESQERFNGMSHQE